MSIIRIVRLTFPIENTEKFAEIFHASKDRIAQFDGCLSVEIMKDHNDPQVYYTYSKWDSQNHLDEYRKSAFFKETWTNTKALFSARALAFSMISI